MKKIIIVFVLSALITCPSLAATKAAVKKPVTRPKPAAAKIVKPVPKEWAAKVNGDIISMEWYNRARKASKQAITEELSTESEEYQELLNNNKKAILEQIIEAVILMQWAEREGIDVQDKTIKAKIAALKKSFPSPKEFYMSLSDQGISLEDLELDIKKQIIIERLITQRAKKLAVSDEEMQGFYDKNLDMYEQPKKLHLLQMEFKSLEPAEKEKASMGKGYVFEGEDLGLIEEGQLPIYDDSKLFTLKKGEYSNIISGEAMYYLFYVKNVMAAKNTTFNDAKDNIRKFLLTEKSRTQYMKDLEEEKASAKIIVNDKLKDLFPEVTPVEVTSPEAE